LGSLPLAGTSRAHPIPNGFGQDKAAQFAGISEDSILANFMKQRVLCRDLRRRVLGQAWVIRSVTAITANAVCVMAPPSLWSGNLRLSLVLIPVRLIPATSTEETISFRQIHEPSGTPVR
jgi:hypothetical protein